MDQTELRDAMRAYGRALAVADPIRLQFWDDRGLTMTQLRLMYVLLVDDGCSVGELAGRMSVRPATVTGLTDRLVRQELIERQADLEDRRVVRVSLTAEGRRVLGEIEAAARAYLGPVFAGMGDDAVRRLTTLLEQFTAVADTLMLDDAAANGDQSHRAGRGRAADRRDG